MKKLNKKVAILIITMNKKQLITDCLTSLRKKTDYKNYKVIVMDNGSTDGSIELIKSKFKWVDLIENGKNLGFARANNEGIKYSIKKYNPDYFFLLNDDTKFIQDDWLDKLLDVAESDDKIGIVGCRLIYPDGSLQFYAVKHKTFMAYKEHKLSNKEDEGIIQEVNLNIGATFLIKKSLINKIGLLDPGYHPIYGEEIDYCERTIKNGFKIMYTPFATIIHLGSATTKDKKKGLWKWALQKKMSIRLELIQFNLLKIIYWQIMHFGSVFLKKEDGKTKFANDFYKRFFLLIMAYGYILTQMSNILYRRRNIHKKLWY